jgi:hypothetical protein
MNTTIYEHACEEIPQSTYDPAMDAPEPPTPRRKASIVTRRHALGNCHDLHGETRLYTGKYRFRDEILKYAAIGISYPTTIIPVNCDRKSAATMLRAIRKEVSC